jgi:hypothetical protein
MRFAFIQGNVSDAAQVPSCGVMVPGGAHTLMCRRDVPSIFRFDTGRQHALDLSRLRSYQSHIESYLETENEAGAVTMTQWLRTEYNVRTSRDTMRKLMEPAGE